MSEWKEGDKCYYVNKETDSEVECYFLEDVDSEVCKLKIKGEKKIAFMHKSRLTKIDPPYWKSLEEDLEECGFVKDKYD